MAQRLATLGDKRLTRLTMDSIRGPAAAVAILAFFGPNQATFSGSLASLTPAITATTAVTGSLGASLADVTIGSAGGPIVQGGASLSLDGVALVATSAAQAAATLTASLEGCTASSVAVVEAHAALSTSLDSLSAGSTVAISQEYHAEVSAVLGDLGTAFTFTAQPEVSAHIDVADIPVNARVRVLAL